MVNVGLLLAIVAVAALFRLAGLDRVPPGINQDEAARAYDAYCIQETGTDHYGERYPILFRGVGERDYPPGVYVYLLAPLQAVFGMSNESTRLPSALLGTANVVFLFLLVRRFYSERVALLGALFLAISPWHVHLSRIGLEACICNPLLTLGLWLGCALLDPPVAEGRARALKALRILAGGAFLGLTAWSYNAYRVAVPALLIGLPLLYPRAALASIKAPTRRWRLLLACIGFVIALSPFLYAWHREPHHAWARASAVAVSEGFGALWTIVRTYLLHFTPRFLFLEGDPSLTQSINHYGQLHWFSAVFVPLGIVRVIRRYRQEPFGRFAIWWVLIGPIGPAFTRLEAGHALRAPASIPGWEILAALGLHYALCWAKEKGQLHLRATAAFAGASIALCVTYFAFQFFVIYPREAAYVFQTEWEPVFADVRRMEKNYTYIMLTSDQSNQVPLLFLVDARIEPRTFIGKATIQPTADWDYITRWEKYLFASTEYLPQIVPQLAPGDRLLIVERPRVQISGATELKRYPVNGEDALILWEAIKPPQPAAP